MDHPIFENALPLVLHTGDLKPILSPDRGMISKAKANYLVIRAEDDVAITRAILLGVFLFFRVRIIQVAIYSLVIRRCGSRLWRLWERRVLGARGKRGR